MSPKRCLDVFTRPASPTSLDAGAIPPFVRPPPSPRTSPKVDDDVSDAALRIFLGATTFAGVPACPSLDFSFRAGARAGTISLANSLTSTAPSSLLSRSTISYSPYRSTRIARFGCTSHTVRRIRRRLSRKTALLWCGPSLSMIRLKKADLASPMVMVFEIRQILSNGSRRFSNELALAETKHFRSASMDLGFVSSSSTRAVSSSSLSLYSAHRV